MIPKQSVADCLLLMRFVIVVANGDVRLDNVLLSGSDASITKCFCDCFHSCFHVLPVGV
jgi:hypothetical protein